MSRMKPLTVFKHITNITSAFLITLSSMGSALLIPQVAHANPTTAVSISNITELRYAVENQADGQTWTIKAGNYGLDRFNDITAGGETGWYLPITKNHITINGVGNPTLFGNEYSANGNWSSQNLVSVFGDNVTINGLTLMPKVDPNKTVEVLGNDFTLENTTITPNTKVDSSVYANVTPLADEVFAKQWGGSIYFSHAGNHLLKNVTVNNAGISFRYSPAGTNIVFDSVNIVNQTNDNVINAYRYSSVFNDSSNTKTGAPKVTYNVNSTLNNLDSVLAGAQNDDVLNINSDLTASHQINITQALTINGNGRTVTATSTIPNNSAVIAPSVANGLTISNLTVDGAGVAKLHGINAFKSTMDLNDVTVKNSTKSGLVVNSSQVTVNNITTLNNTWNGIDVDQNNASSAWPSKLTVNGTSTHTEAGPDILIDNITKPVSVIDTNSQYIVASYGNARVYKLKPVPPTLTVTTPSEGQSVATVTNGNKLKITGSFTDDVKANYATMQLVYNGNSVAIGTLYGYGSAYNHAATYAAADGSYVFNLPVPTNLANGEYSLFYTGTDFDGGATTRMERKLVIDNVNPTAPTITSPDARTWYNTAPIVDKWTAVTDDLSGISHYQIAYHYNDGHSFSNSSCPDLTITGYSGFIGCRDVAGTQRDHTPGADEQGGVTIWVRAIDNAGNVGPWSRSVNYHYDSTAATTTIGVSPLHSGVTGNEFTVSGDASDNLALNRVYVQLINRSTGARYGGTTINLIPDGKTGHWAHDYNATSTGLPDGNYYAVATATDMAGNSTTTPFFEFSVDNTVPVVDDEFIVSILTGEEVTLDPEVSDDTDVTYLWYVSDDQLTKDPNDSLDGSTLAIGPAHPGNYTATLTVTDLAGNATKFIYNVTISTPAATPGGRGANTANITPTALPIAETSAVLGDSVVALNTVPVVEPAVEKDNNNGKVKGDDTAQAKSNNTEVASTTGFLGLGWWWLPVLLVSFGILWFFGASLRHKRSRY